jgi:hypothetical protein
MRDRSISVLSSRARYGRHIISIDSLVLSAVYPILEIPLYARFLVARQFEWVARSETKTAISRLKEFSQLTRYDRR